MTEHTFCDCGFTNEASLSWLVSNWLPLHKEYYSHWVLWWGIKSIQKTHSLVTGKHADVQLIVTTRPFPCFRKYTFRKWPRCSDWMCNVTICLIYYNTRTPECHTSQLLLFYLICLTKKKDCQPACFLTNAFLINDIGLFFGSYEALLLSLEFVVFSALF